MTCLRRLGLYGEVGRELSRRVESGAEGVKKGNVLATLAGEELTEADLDRMIQRRVEQILSLQGANRIEPMRQKLMARYDVRIMPQKEERTENSQTEQKEDESTSESHENRK